MKTERQKSREIFNTVGVFIESEDYEMVKIILDNVNISKTETKVKEFALAPAVERTKAEIKSRNQSKVKNDFNPINEDKRKQFERLLKKQNKKQ